MRLPQCSATGCRAQNAAAGGADAFYHGATSPYPFSLNWLDEFADPQLAKTLYGCPFPLIDVTVMPDDDIVQHRRVALLELMQKHIRQRDLSGITESLAAVVMLGYTNRRQLRMLFHYMLQYGNTAEPGVFLRRLARRLPQYEETLMSIAQKLKQEGRQQGRLEGREEGHWRACRKAADARRCALPAVCYRMASTKRWYRRSPDCRLMNYSRCVVNVLPRQPLPGAKIRRAGLR